ncbi:hypothetical protein HMPREF9946_02918 [Acetobacteraceae bacterium AT-5844]|nr:hypothetical protein HMPREF9946_02918 [Acetobacteraceae bacterium AT-5844]
MDNMPGSRFCCCCLDLSLSRRGCVGVTTSQPAEKLVATPTIPSSRWHPPPAFAKTVA